jgi:hypothetical protein
MAGGDLSAEELTLHLLDRIRRHDGTLGSVLELNPAALSEARALDERRRSGAVAGPLHGIPVTVKDNIETAGPMHTTAGSMALAEHIATRDADKVDERTRSRGSPARPVSGSCASRHSLVAEVPHAVHRVRRTQQKEDRDAAQGAHDRGHREAQPEPVELGPRCQGARAADASIR